MQFKHEHPKPKTERSLLQLHILFIYQIDIASYLTRSDFGWHINKHIMKANNHYKDIDKH